MVIGNVFHQFSIVPSQKRQNLIEPWENLLVTDNVASDLGLWFQDAVLSAVVTAADTVTVTLLDTTAGDVDSTPATLFARVSKPRLASGGVGAGQLSLSRGARLRPRSQRGSGTGSSIESVNTLWPAARSSRFGRSSSSRNSCHGGLLDLAGSCGGGGGDGRCFLSFI
jgi:hypothetical protein